MKLVRISYTIYSPNYVRGQGECWDFPTFRGAKAKARALGVGSLIVRNFNKAAKAGDSEDWWQSALSWVWNGVSFSKAHSLDEKKWVVVTDNCWHRSPLQTRNRFKRR